MKNFTKTILSGLCLCAALMCAGCTGQTAESLSFDAMDTFMKLDVYAADGTAEKIKSDVLLLDSLLSTESPDSDVARLNKSGSASVDPATAELIRQTLGFCRDTDGALDITVYPVVSEWGFVSGDFKIPGKAKIEKLLESVDYQRVKLNGNGVSLDSGTQIDLGASAKGYAADRAFDILRENNSGSAILNLGGTVAAFGAKPGGEPWKVGIANPENSSDYVGYVRCKNKIAATSGSYERYFTGSDGKRYCHIINPKTGYPADGEVLSVTVISDSGVKCDCLSTALFVMGKDRAIEYQKAGKDFDMVILCKGGKAYVTPGIKDDFILAGDSGYQVETAE